MSWCDGCAAGMPRMRHKPSGKICHVHSSGLTWLCTVNIVPAYRCKHCSLLRCFSKDQSCWECRQNIQEAQKLKPENIVDWYRKALENVLQGGLPSGSGKDPPPHTYRGYDVLPVTPIGKKVP